MTDFFFICLIKSPQCADKYSKEKIMIAIFLPRVDVPKASNFTKTDFLVIFLL